jgi:hypothetical protein
VTQTQRYQLIIPLRQMLTLLERILPIEYPSWVLPSLSKMPIGYHELRNYHLFPDNLLLNLKALLIRYASPLLP